MSVGDLSAISTEDLSDLLEVTEDEAKTLIDQTHARIEAADIQLQPEEEEEIVSASAIPAYSGMLRESATEEDDGEKFSDAEKRLREELAAFKLK